ncbi:D-lactate dehydrogenase,mitochondrial [Taphrina deformans PYCC 5710]|uniref:D-lactate dehydrogenase (cytochrome) n=1 Tax=Taphrina deformans (strain PYCC 5710 / ATCC 11124 / CBS 356.35 / IMI 108563 / JCM 9778 / NBRC 8474) TaxID=1097556 RepID=R4X6S0_TAPDE|nr:D-lactate dehydrogenase,mitochondrial [Taphrina deformans PYCC 5710]|eukprot:CCG80621.1 D-lactate dehydrogenase,mitochondrial [Taphrina deformans PYCC 5710]
MIDPIVRRPGSGGIRWSTGKALALSTLTGLATYSIGLLSNRDAAYKASNSSILRDRTVVPKYGAKAELDKALPEIREFMGEDGITTDPEELERHGFSSWSTYNIDTRPIAVAFPKTTEEVSKMAKICHKYHLPIIGYSGGTSLEGHFSATEGGVCVDFVHMDKVLDIHVEDLDVVVQPSVGWQELNEVLKEKNLFFPPDPGPGAKIGGMVGTGCSGTNASRYGTMRENVLNLTVVLADGTIIKTRQRPRKSSAGYDLTRLFIGSEGTLGLVTEATLKLTVLPEQTRVAIAPFESIRDAASCVAKIMATGLQVGALELLDDVQMKVVNDAGDQARKYDEKPTLFLKFSGSPAGVKEQIEKVQTIAKETKARSFDFARNDKEGADLWSARKEALWSMIASQQNENDGVWNTDMAVPLSKLPMIIEEAKAKMDKTGVLASIVAHAGDGNFHNIILYNKNDPAEKAMVEQAVHELVQRAIELDGTCTGEHGVGLVKKKYLVEELGEDTLGLMKKIKMAIDPLDIMNPGKIFDFEVAK